MGLCSNQARDLNNADYKGWNKLASIGRPLWSSLNQNTLTMRESQVIFNKLAASKLLLGQDPTNAASYIDFTLHGALESHVLLQFKVMLDYGMVDESNIGDIVAQIFLLLAMDAVIMDNEVMEKAPLKKDFIFTGQFCNVTDCGYCYQQNICRGDGER
ncbi:hypothetical protein PHMEG_00024167 [Phytophthora megakarya]|uniref:Uncharacterized protein n=1 Tax=Phytophthora megakarya TaxID=4795 RepID=A0A225VEP3_9STRA|nr:hypothetical protein PHMEG_00024167 [Phytophthora megakarya]